MCIFVGVHRQILAKMPFLPLKHPSRPAHWANRKDMLWKKGHRIDALAAWGPHVVERWVQVTHWLFVQLRNLFIHRTVKRKIRKLHQRASIKFLQWTAVTCSHPLFPETFLFGRDKLENAQSFPILTAVNTCLCFYYSCIYLFIYLFI